MNNFFVNIVLITSLLLWIITEYPVNAMNSQSSEMSLVGLAEQSAYKHGLNPALFLALIKQESNWNELAVSSKGAVGLTQLMPAAAVDCGLQDEERYEAQANLDCGAWHLSRHYREFKDIEKALCAYNAGATRVRKLGNCPNFKETQAYVARIMKDYQGG